jgi:hypothetical protein
MNLVAPHERRDGSLAGSGHFCDAKFALRKVFPEEHTARLAASPSPARPRHSAMDVRWHVNLQRRLLSADPARRNRGDTGGYAEIGDREVFARWLELSAFCLIMEIGGVGTHARVARILSGG